MRKPILYFSFFIFHFSFAFGTLSAQNINFKDTNSLKVLLCSKTWIRYDVNKDSTYSNKELDSIQFKMDGTVHRSSEPKYDSGIFNREGLSMVGTWHLGPTSTISRSDSASECIDINMVCLYPPYTGVENTSYELVDGHRINQTKQGRFLGNIDHPFLIDKGLFFAIGWDRHVVYQSPRHFEKPKVHSKRK